MLQRQAKPHEEEEEQPPVYDVEATRDAGKLEPVESEGKDPGWKEEEEEGEWPPVYDVAPTRDASELDPVESEGEESEWEEEDEEEISIQAKLAGGQTPQVSPKLAAQIRSLKGGGRLLSQAERDFFEPRFDYGFSQVRIHTGRQAAEIAQAVGAQAFVLGQNIVFRGGQHAPDSGEGRRLLAHELTHVLQQDSEPCMGKTIRRQSRDGTTARGLPTVKVGGVTYVTTDPGELVKADHPAIKRIDPQKRSKYQRFKHLLVNFLVRTRPMRTSSKPKYRNTARAWTFYWVFIGALERSRLPVTLWPYLITAMERENLMGLQHVTQNVFNVDVVKDLTNPIAARFSRIKHPGMKSWLTRAGINLTTVTTFKRDMGKLGQLVSTNNPAKIAKAALLLLAYTSKQLYLAFASTTARRKDFSTRVRALKPIERAVMVFFAASGWKLKSGKQVSGIVQARRLLKRLPVAAIGKGFSAAEKREARKGLRGQYAQFISRYAQIRQKLIAWGKTF